MVPACAALGLQLGLSCRFRKNLQASKKNSLWLPCRQHPPQVPCTSPQTAACRASSRRFLDSHPTDKCRRTPFRRLHRADVHKKTNAQAVASPPVQLTDHLADQLCSEIDRSYVYIYIYIYIYVYIYILPSNLMSFAPRVL